MPTDDERREVARRLRGIKDTREGCGHDMCCDLWSAIFDSDYRCTDLCDECEVAVLNSLADLIEPDKTSDTTKSQTSSLSSSLCERGVSAGSFEATPKCSEPTPKRDASATHTDASATCDREKLLALADEIDDWKIWSCTAERSWSRSVARRIRDACGVSGDV